MMKTRKQQYLDRIHALRQEREEWLHHWRDVAENFSPSSFRYLSSDRQKAGRKQNQKIINNTPPLAQRTASAGMMSGLTSPSRPWFRLSLQDPALQDSQAAKLWLSDAEAALRESFAKSNVYAALHDVYSGLLNFGTAAMLIEEDKEDGIRAYVFPVGQFCLANSDRLAVDTLVREFEMTTAQLVKKFGLENCSDQVRDNFNNGDLDRWHAVCHVLEPNDAYRPGKLGPAGKVWRSCWFEVSETSNEKFLRDSGYSEMPFMAPRWQRTGEDAYGVSPAMLALGDCRALQQRELRKAELIDKIARPPMTAPVSLQSHRTSLLPGDVTFVPGVGGQKFEPAMQVNPQALVAIEAEIQGLESHIRKALYADLWLLLSESDGRMTAREVIERRDEKLLQLGSVLETLQDELLDPLISRCFSILLRQGRIPVPPQEIAGLDLRVEYLSMMVQAQKIQGTTAVERLVSFVGSLAGVKPEVLDKIDTDEMVDSYAEMLGTAPSVVRTDDQVAQIRAQRAQAVAQQQQAMQAETLSKTAKNLAGADMEGDNALSTMLRSMGAA